MLSDLERIVFEVVLVVLVFEKLVSRSASAALYLSDEFVLGCPIGDHLASVADESGETRTAPSGRW